MYLRIEPGLLSCQTSLQGLESLVGPGTGIFCAAHSSRVCTLDGTGCTQVWGGAERVVIPCAAAFLARVGEMGNFSLAVLTSHSLFSSSVSVLGPSALFWRCPLPRADQRDPLNHTHSDLPPDRGCHPPLPLLQTPAQLSFVSRERPTPLQPLWLGLSLGEINSQKSGPQMFFLLCETCSDHYPWFPCLSPLPPHQILNDLIACPLNVY